MQYNTAFICSFLCLAAIASVRPVVILKPSSLDLKTLKPTPPHELSSRPKVIVISLGGLKRGFVDSVRTPHLDVFHGKYASAEYLKPVFPSKTHVNLFSIATGLYAGQHGMIYDCTFDKPTEPNNPCEYERYKQNLRPIWIENKLSGGVSGVLNWSGSNQQYQGLKPDYSIGPEEVCEDPLMKMIEWLEHKTQPANLIMAHFDELDKINRKYSPYTDSIKEVMQRMDLSVKNFIDILEKKGIKQYIDIIIIGTQGIHEALFKDGIDIERDLEYSKIPFNSMGANAILSPTTEEEYKNVYNQFKALEFKDDHGLKERKYNVYKHKDIPDKWHLKDLPLFEDKLFLVAEPGFFFWSDHIFKIQEAVVPDFFKPYQLVDRDWFAFGMDGYDNDDNSMKTLFIGMGPHFKRSTQAKYFHTIDIHPLLRKLLHLEGDISDDQPQTLLNDRIRTFLRDPVYTTSMEEKEREENVREIDIVQSTKQDKKRSRFGCLRKLFGGPKT